MIPFFSLDDEFHYETEGDHYDEAYGPGLHRQYSTDGEIYHDHDIMGYNEHGGQRESHTTIHIEDDDQPESSSYGHGHYGTTDIREQSHRYQDNGKRWSETGDSRHSYHTDETSDRGNRLVSFAVIQCSENVKERWVVKLLFLSFPSVALSL